MHIVNLCKILYDWLCCAGKTYVGILLMKLLVQQNFGGPILTVTQTNHAVDSLLEGCLDADVVKNPGEMIRIGGRSKSARLEPYNLRQVSVLSASLHRMLCS